MKLKETMKKVTEVSKLAISKGEEVSEMKFIKSDELRKKMRVVCALSLPVALLALLGLKHIAMGIVAVTALLLVLSQAKMDALLEKIEKSGEKVVSSEKDSSGEKSGNKKSSEKDDKEKSSEKKGKTSK